MEFEAGREVQARGYDQGKGPLADEPPELPTTQAQRADQKSKLIVMICARPQPPRFTSVLWLLLLPYGAATSVPSYS